VGDRPYALRIAAYAPGSSWAGRALRRLRAGAEGAFLVPAVVAGQRLERLLVGSFATSEEAEEHGRVLRQRGLVEEYAVMRLAYAVELGRYPDRARAAEALAQLADAGRTAYLQEGPDGSIRLLAGAFASEEEARAYTSAAPAVAGQGRVAAR
jgi:cell division septation protein DedD